MVIICWRRIWGSARWAGVLIRMGVVGLEIIRIGLFLGWGPGREPSGILYRGIRGRLMGESMLRR